MSYICRHISNKVHIVYDYKFTSAIISSGINLDCTQKQVSNGRIDIFFNCVAK